MADPVHSCHFPKCGTRTFSSLSQREPWPKLLSSKCPLRPRPVAHPRPLSVRFRRQQLFLAWIGDETLALRLLARELARPADRLGSFPCRSLGRLFVKPSLLHLAE